MEIFRINWSGCVIMSKCYTLKPALLPSPPNTANIRCYITGQSSRFAFRCLSRIDLMKESIAAQSFWYASILHTGFSGVCMGLLRDIVTEHSDPCDPLYSTPPSTGIFLVYVSRDSGGDAIRCIWSTSAPKMLCLMRSLANGHLLSCEISLIYSSRELSPIRMATRLQQISLLFDFF